MITAAAHHATTSPVLVIIWVLLGATFYFIPTIVAWVRKVPNAMSVTVINLFTGWLIIGWIVALAMACRSGHLRNTVTGERP